MKIKGKLRRVSTDSNATRLDLSLKYLNGCLLSIFCKPHEQECSTQSYIILDSVKLYGNCTLYDGVLSSIAHLIILISYITAYNNRFSHTELNVTFKIFYMCYT